MTARTNGHGHGEGEQSFRSAEPVHRGGISHEFIEALKSIHAPRDVVVWAEEHESPEAMSERQRDQEGLLRKAKASPGVADVVQVSEGLHRFLEAARPNRPFKANYSTGGNI
jgi:hypothetical protein